MKIIRVFPRRTSLTPRDDYSFVGDPPLMRPEADEVHVSVTFTWDARAGRRLVEAWSQYYPVVKIGGPAFYSLCHTFSPGQYVRNGVTFTSRGCNNECPWCLVRKSEGRLMELPDFSAGHIIQDNNLLQCGSRHLDRVFAMLAGQRGIELSGGLDARLVTTAFADRLRGLRIYQLFLACDTAGSLKMLQRAVKRLAMPRDKMRCYVLIGFDGEAISQATARLEGVWAAGCMPFAQLYQPADQWIDYPKEWRDLNRRWSRPAIMRTMHKATQ